MKNSLGFSKFKRSFLPEREHKLKGKLLQNSFFDKIMNDKEKPDDLPSVDTNQSGNTESNFFPCIAYTHKPPRGIRKPLTMVFENKDGSQTASHNENQTEIQRDSRYKEIAFINSPRQDSAKRKPLHLPLPRKTSNKFMGYTGASYPRGRPMWNISSRIENRTRSFSNIASPERSGRTISMPSKYSALERSKQNPKLECQESVFERLYRDGRQQRASLRPLTAEIPTVNRRQARVVSPHKIVTNRTLRKPRRSPISPSHKPHGEEFAPKHHKSHIDRLPSIVIQSRNQALKQSSPLKLQSSPPIKRQRRRDLERVSNPILKSNGPLISKEDAITWKKISAKTYELVSDEAVSDNLNALITQLIEEQSISPTQVTSNKRAVSLNSSTALLMEDSLTTEAFSEQKSALVAASVEMGGQKFVTDFVIPRVVHSTEHVYQLKPNEEYESVIAFTESSENALLIDTIVNDSSSSNPTAIVDALIDSTFQEISSYSVADTNFALFAPPEKDARIDRLESDIKSLILSTRRANASITEEANNFGYMNPSQNNDNSKVIVEKAVLSRSCEEIVERSDLPLIQTLSDLSSFEENDEDNERDSVVDESMISLNSISSSSLQECVEDLNNNTIRKNEVTEGFKLASEKYDRMDALQSTMFRRDMESFLGAMEFVSFNMSNAKGLAQLSQFVGTQNFSDSSSATIEEMRQCLIDVNKKKTASVHVEVHVSSENGSMEFLQPLRLFGNSHLSAPHGSNKMLEGSSKTSSDCSKVPQRQKEADEQEGGGRYKLAKMRSPEYILRRYPPERIAKEIGRLRVALYDVHSRFRDAGITNRETVRDLKQSYRGIIFALRNLLNSRRDVKCKNAENALGAIMVQCVEQFVTLVNNKVVRHDWLPCWDKGCLMRLKADFIRYLYEIFPDNESYRRKCHEAYRSARSFFLENCLKDRAEWVYLNMNYSAFFYMVGETSRAQFINERLLNTLVARRCGDEIQMKLLMNLKFYNQL